MLITLIAILCNGPLCLEKVVTTSEQSDISMVSCATTSQSAIADWLDHGPYRAWQVAKIKCVMGPYQPKRGV